MVREAFVLGRPAEKGRIPFSANEILFKPICLYPVDAARSSGIERVSFLLPERDDRMSGLFPENVPTCAYSAFLKSTFDSAERVLLLSDDAFLLTPAQIRLLTEQEKIVLTHGKDWVAAMVEAAHLNMLSDADSVLRLQDLWHCSAEAFFAQPYLGFYERSKQSLFKISERMRMEILYRWMDAGVTIASADGVLVGPDVQLGADTTLLPGTELRGHTRVGSRCALGPNTVVTDSLIGDECVVEASKLTRVVLRNRVRVGPFAQLRPGSELANGVKIGDFVEVKNSRVGAGTSVSHLTYVGDADVGERVNFGCGVATCNYDGFQKSRTAVGDGAFLGCNTNLVAPVTVGAGAYTAAGTTITDDVPPNALAIGRSRQENHENWAVTCRERKEKMKNDGHI